MSDTEIIEFALRAAELAAQIGAATIQHEMLTLAADRLNRYAPPLRVIPEVVIETDYYRGSPCS